MAPKGAKNNKLLAQTKASSEEGVPDTSFAAKLSRMIGKLKYIPSSKKATEEEKQDI